MAPAPVGQVLGLVAPVSEGLPFLIGQASTEVQDDLGSQMSCNSVADLLSERNADAHHDVRVLIRLGGLDEPLHAVRQVVAGQLRLDKAFTAPDVMTPSRVVVRLDAHRPKGMDQLHVFFADEQDLDAVHEHPLSMKSQCVARTIGVFITVFALVEQA